MRSLKDFDRAEWLRLLPLEALFKQVRNDAWRWLFDRQRAPGLEALVARVKRESPGKTVLLVIAFEQAWALDWLLRNAAKHLQDALVVVCDNSRSAEARAAIAAVCQSHDAPHVALPHNRTRHVNRSHALAMSWVYRNVVLPAAPDIFGFIDHDLIPFKDVNLAERLIDQPFFGHRVKSRWAYQLWAGYCLYRYANVKGARLNFLYDFSLGLDTGGRNWARLYRHVDPAGLRFAHNEYRLVVDTSSAQSARVQVLDGCWLHIGGISYNDGFRPKAQLFEWLASSLEQDGALLDRSPCVSAS